MSACGASRKYARAHTRARVRCTKQIRSRHVYRDAPMEKRDTQTNKTCRVMATTTRRRPIECPKSIQAECVCACVQQVFELIRSLNVSIASSANGLEIETYARAAQNATESIDFRRFGECRTLDCIARVSTIKRTCRYTSKML